MFGQAEKKKKTGLICQYVDTYVEYYKQGTLRLQNAHFKSDTKGTSKSLQAKLVDMIPFFIKSSNNSGCLLARWTRSFAVLKQKVCVK